MAPSNPNNRFIADDRTTVNLDFVDAVTQRDLDRGPNEIEKVALLLRGGQTVFLRNVSYAEVVRLWKGEIGVSVPNPPSNFSVS